MSRHHMVNPGDLPPPTGFSYGSVAAPGRVLHIAGMVGQRPDSSFDASIVDQFGRAAWGMWKVIEEAGGAPTDLVSLTIYTTSIDDYRENLEPIGVAYREVFGRHYPPMALIGVTRLFDEAVKVELVGVAVVPDQPGE
jgi:enamine deaminase RidA (YjgF/YER057c/UK114 family)